MYVGTIVEYIDNSEIPEITVDLDSAEPFFITAFSSEKGPEDPVVIGGEDFYKVFVTPDNTQDSGYFIPFAKHGQPLLQAANIVDNGGKLYAKRVVADDATLANTVIYGHVSDAGDGVAKVGYTYKYVENARSFKDVVDGVSTDTSESLTFTATGTKAAGDYSFTDSTGKVYEFNLANAMADGDKLTWITGDTKVTITSADGTTTTADIRAVESSTLEAIATTGESMESVKLFPLLIIADNGRGVCKKRFRIIPSYQYSKDQEFMIYNLQVVEENRVLVNPLISFDPDIMFLGSSIGIDNQFKSTLSQLKTKFMEPSYLAFLDAIAEITGMTADEVKVIDFINGTTRKGEPLTKIITSNEIDPVSGIDLQNGYGNELFGGSTGAFGNKPITTPEYETKLIEFFTGQYTSDIYDSDNYKFDVIFDANYPDKVKKAIEDYVMFREDVFFFCDFGTKVHNFSDIEEIVNPLASGPDHRHADTKFVAYYCNYWDMLDPYTRRPITVTIMYDLAGYCVNHFLGGRIRPYAGQLYGMVFPKHIQGTVNYIPKIIPGLNQKEQIADVRVNYVVYYDGELTLDSEWTSQKKHTQFSYINNILATQEVVKQIRTICPKNRYTFLDKESLNKYKEAVETMVLSRYRANFETLEMVYLGDSTYELNKIFYAGINVRFRNFIQTEIFKVYALL